MGVRESAVHLCGSSLLQNKGRKPRVDEYGGTCVRITNVVAQIKSRNGRVNPDKHKDK